MSRPPPYISPKLQARVSQQLALSPGSIGDPAADQEKKIIAQQVEQAIHHLVDDHSRAAGRPPTVSHAGDEGPAAPAGLSGAQLQQRAAPRLAADRGDPVLLARSGRGSEPAGGPDLLQGFAVEFVPGQLGFASDLAVLFLCCAPPIVALSGTHTLSILLVGVIASYIFDYTNQRMLTLVAAWVTVICVWLGLYVTNLQLLWASPLTILILLDASLFLMLVGVFATVQFRWFQLEAPEAALAGERVLLGLTPLICLPLLFSTVVTLCGTNAAPFVFALVLSLLHRRFYCLRRSSFKQALTVEAAPEQYINGRLEALVSCILTLFLPSALYVAVVHRGHISLLHLLNLSALLGIPAMALFQDPLRCLWFMMRSPHAEDNADKGDVWGVRSLRIPCCLGGYLGVLHCFLYRVLMGRYAHLLTGVPPPWNVVLICIGAYALSATVLFAVQLVEMEQRKDLGWAVALRWMSVLFLSVIGSMALAFVVGMPRFIQPFSALSAACLTAYCLDRRNVNNYLLFAGCTVLMLMWWMFKSFSFLVVELPILGGTQSVSLPQLAVYIIWLYMLETILFPLGFHRQSGMFHFCLLLQAAALTAVEHILYSQPENLYPFTAVAFTSFWGLKMTDRMLTNKRLSKGQASLLGGMYVAKLYLFAVCATSPEPGSEHYTRAFRAAELVLCYFGAAGMTAAVLQLALERREKKRRAHSGTFCAVYCAAACVVAWLSRQNVVLSILELTTGNSSVQAGRLFGLVLVLAGVLQLPLCSLLPASQGRVSRIAAGMLCAGALIALMDPVLEGDAAPDELELDVYQPPWWAEWLAVAAVAGVAATLTNLVRLPDSAAVRMAWWGGISAAAGTAFAQLYLPHSTWHTAGLIALVFVLLALCVDFCHFSENAQHEDSNTVVGLYTALLLSLLAALLDGQYRFPEGFDEAMRWETAMQRQMGILSLNAGMNILLAALMKLKLAESPLFVPRTIAKIDAIRGNMGQGTHFGLLCNICSMQSFLSMVILNSNLGGTSAGMGVLLSSLLLLMHDDGWMFTGLADPDQLARWAPPLAAALCTLSWKVCGTELPLMLNRAPLMFALQLSIFLIALVLGLVTLRELWTDAHRRRRNGPADGFVLGIGLVMMLGAATSGVRWTVAVTVLGAAVPVYADTFWARKLSAVF